VHKKSAEDATRRLLKVARDHEKAAAEVTQLRLLVSEAERQQADLSAQIAAAQHEAAEATALYQAHKGEVRSPLMATDCATTRQRSRAISPPAATAHWSAPAEELLMSFQ